MKATRSLRDLVVALAEDGNRALAEKVAANEAGQQGQLLLEAVDSTRPVSSSVLAPLPNPSEGSDGILARLEIDTDGGFPTALGPIGRSCADRALKDAWELCNGVGECPRLGVRIPLAQHCDLEIEGTSLYLPVLIAAVAALGGERLTSNVVATGDFESDISLLSAKASISSRGDLGSGASLLVATRRRPASIPASVTVVQSAAEAVSRLFEIRPRHASAPTSHVHVSCGAARALPTVRTPGPQTKVIQVDLGDEVAASDLPMVLQRVSHAVFQEQACDVTIAGPVVLGYWLGATLRNSPTDLRIIDARTRRVWWHNRVRSPDLPFDPAPGTGKMVVSCNPGRVPTGWSALSLSPNLSSEEVREEAFRIASVLGRAEADLQLALDCPIAFAWAIGHLSALRPGISVYHFDRDTGRYERWFGTDNCRRGG